MSIIVSLAPLLGWKDENWSLNVMDGKCMVRIIVSPDTWCLDSLFRLSRSLIHGGKNVIFDRTSSIQSWKRGQIKEIRKRYFYVGQNEVC